MLTIDTIVGSLRNGTWITRGRIRVYPRIFLGVFLIGFTWLIVSPVGPRWSGADFVGFWVPAHLAAVGDAVAVYDQPLFAMLQGAISGRTDEFLPWVYPPTFLLLILPLGLLPYATALAVWLLAGVAAYWAAIRKLAGSDGILLALAFPGVMICLYNGHAELLLASLFGGAMLLLDRRPWVAGLLIALCSVKPHLFLLVPVALLASGRWRVIASAAAAVLLCAAMSAAVLGTDLWRDFFASVAGLGGGAVHDTASLGGVLAKQQSAFAFGLRFGGLYVGVAFQFTAMALAGWAVAKTWAGGRPLADRAIVLCCGTLLSAPYLFDYDLALLVVPIAILAREGRTHGFRPWQKSLLAALWLAPAVVRLCSLYADVPATIILLGVSIVVFVVPPRQFERGLGSGKLDRSQESTASIPV